MNTRSRRPVPRPTVSQRTGPFGSPRSTPARSAGSRPPVSSPNSPYPPPLANRSQSRRARGALWFVEAGVNQVGRITTTGTITEYRVPSNGTLVDIATGSDGAPWFTQPGTNQIDRLAPPAVANTSVLAATLPSSRSVQ